MLTEASACPLSARSAGQRRELTVTPGQSEIPAHLRTGWLTRCAYRPSKQRVQGWIRQTWDMGSAFVKKINDLDEEAFQALYGRWDPLEPAQVAELFRAPSVRWWIAGGRAARAGAPDRHHEDIDVAVRIDDLDGLRKDLSDWHLWEANSGTLRPLLPGDHLTGGCEQLWARRNAQHPWQLDLVLDRSGEDEWVFKRDARIRVPWERALYTVNGIQYLRPEIALLHKAHLDRPKDKADLAAARLDPDAWDWLAETLDQLGYRTWADLARTSAGCTPKETSLVRDEEVAAPAACPIREATADSHGLSRTTTH